MYCSLNRLESLFQNLILVLDLSLLQFFSAKRQLILWQGCFFPLFHSLQQHRGSEGKPKSPRAPQCVSGYLLDTVIFCPKVIPPNALGGSCTLVLTTSTAFYEFLPCVNTDMSVTALTAVYISPENQRKATLSEPGLGEFLSRRNENPSWNLQQIPLFD